MNSLTRAHCYHSWVFPDRTTKPRRPLSSGPDRLSALRASLSITVATDRQAIVDSIRRLQVYGEPDRQATTSEIMAAARGLLRNSASGVRVGKDVTGVS